MDTPEAWKLLEETFPQLLPDSYKITSPRTADYNCIAFAAGDQSIYWYPLSTEPYAYWPRRVPRDRSVKSLITAYATIGYSPCDHGEPEAGVEKIAIYATENGKFTHAALQLLGGRWTSKCGQLEDIEHDELDGLQCTDYGAVKCFLSLPRKAGD